MADRMLHADVAITGAGPVGATLAALLGQANVSVFIADASRTVYPLPRAAHFDHEIMRIFQQLGIVDAIHHAIIPVDRYVFQNKVGDVLLEFDFRKPADTGWAGYMMHQPGVETAIRKRIMADPQIELRTGASFRRAAAGTDLITSFWEDDEGSFEVRSRFLVGCDGAGSLVRDKAGITLEDLGFDEPWLVLDVVVDAQNGFPTTNIQYCDPDRPTTYVVMGDRRRRFEFMLKPGETAGAMLEDSSIAALLEPWNTLGLQTVERKAVYRFHALVADHWRNANILIAGDAAHQMPPFAGQGMCSGIRDAAALAWRLPLALRSGDAHFMLDSYQAEREPHVRTITAAAIETGRVVCTLDPVLAAGRDAQMLASRAAGEAMPDIRSPQLGIVFGLSETRRAGELFFQPVSAGSDDAPLRMDDVLGTGAWLITRQAFDGNTDARLGVTVVRSDAPVLRPFRDAIDRWLLQAGAAAVIVRADRYVFGTGDPAILISAFARMAGMTADGASLR